MELIFYILVSLSVFTVESVDVEITEGTVSASNFSVDGVLKFDADNGRWEKSGFKNIQRKRGYCFFSKVVVSFLIVRYGNRSFTKQL